MILKEKKKMWEGSFFEMWEKKFITPKNKEVKYECPKRKNSNRCVVIVPITSENEFILVKQFRGAFECHTIEFPAGAVDKGEKLKQAAIRELREETGYQAGKLYELFPEGPITPGISEATLSCFLAIDLRFVGHQESDEAGEEGMEVWKISAEGPADTAIDLLKKISLKYPTIKIDSKVGMLIVYAKFFANQNFANQDTAGRNFLWDLI